MDKQFEVIWKLIELGIDDFPVICAVGAQNTGKSTTLNRMAGVNVFPSRRTGDAYNSALTRAVIRVTTLPNYVWKAELTHGDIADRREYGTREALEQEIYTFVSQQQRESKYKLPNGLISEPINIRVWGPGLPPMIFLDNPGMITDDKVLSKPLLDMSIDSVRGRKNTVVLFFINAGLDVHSSPAWYAVNEAVGQVFAVITKPDLAGGDGIGIYEAMNSGIRGIPNSHIYVVKGPDMVAGETGWSQDAEMQFFETKMPKLRSLFSNRIGVENLRSSLRDALVRLYVSNVPAYRNKINQEIAECNRKMLALGAPIDDANRLSIYKRCVKMFCDEVKRHIVIDLSATISNPLEYVEKTRLMLESALQVQLDHYDYSIWDHMADFARTLIDTNEINTFLRMYISILHDEKYGFIEWHHKTAVARNSSFIVSCVRSGFVFNTLNTIQSTLEANTELMRYIKEMPEIVAKRREIEQRLQQLNAVLGMF